MVFVLALFVLFNCLGGTHNEPTRYKYAITESGKIRGHIASDGDYLAFQGIPYAAPPTRENRFQAPKPPVPWEGILDASRVVKCPQMNEGKEDCLVINVFTPTKYMGKTLPVLFYVHGGDFIFGSGPTEGIEPLIQKDLIVVTFNYRLGAPGFLCLGTKDAPGNAGLKDQLAALKWVQRNIAIFGGDPKQVTLYGMSAGGASVEYLILSEMAKGLFNNAIIESGSATSVWASDPDPITTAVNVANLLNIPVDNYLKSLAGHYKTISMDALTAATNNYYRNLTDGTIGFAPCVEKIITDVESLITRSPHDILAAKAYDSVPMIFVFVTLEGMFLRSQEYHEQNYGNRLELNFEEFMPADLVFDNLNDKNFTAKTIKQFYFGTKSVGDDTITEYLNYFGDYLIMHSLLNSVEAHCKNANPVYLMEFAYKGNMGLYDEFYEDLHVAGHGDVSKHVILNRPPLTDLDRRIIERMTTLVANFVKHGHPTPTRNPSTPVMWPPVHPSQKLTFLQLNHEFDMVYDPPCAKRKQFWDEIYKEYRRPVPAVNPGSYSVFNVTGKGSVNILENYLIHLMTKASKEKALSEQT